MQIRKMVVMLWAIGIATGLVVTWVAAQSQAPARNQEALPRSASTDAASVVEPKTVVFNIACGPEEVFRLVSALHVVEDALSDGRRVILLFNGDGVNVPIKRLSPDLRLGDERPLWLMLDDIAKRGAEFVVSKEAMRSLNRVEGEYLAVVQFGAWGGSIFQKLPKDAMVFSY